MHRDWVLAHVVSSHSRNSVEQIANSLHAGYDSKLSEHNVHCSLLCMWVELPVLSIPEGQESLKNDVKDW